MSEAVATETVQTVETSLSAQKEGETTSSTNESYEELLAQGKRNLMCKEIPQALNQLQQASRLVAEKFGETADECAEVYYYYGTALLEMARIENNVLGNALTGIPDEPEEEEENAENDTFVEPDNTTEEEKDKITDEIIEAMVEPSIGCQGDAKDVTPLDDSKEPKQEESLPKVGESGDNKESIGAAEKVTNPEVEKVEEEEKQAAAAEDEKEAEELKEGAEEGAEEGTAEEEGDEDDAGDDTAEEAMDEDLENTSQEDVSNLQLAWEMLEIAKKIYKRNDSAEAKLKEADCWSRLGDIGVETEQYSQATLDYGECLRLLEETVEPSNRRLASTHYNIGVACGYNNAFDDAISHYRSAIKIIEQKIAEVQGMVDKTKDKSDEGKEPESDDPHELAKKELDELQSLIPDIQVKINDAEEEKKAQGLKEVIRQSFKASGNGAEEGTSSNAFQGESSACCSSPSAAEKPVQNVSHLVRKKRKLDEEEPVDDGLKKSKTDETIEETQSKDNGATKLEPTDETSLPLEKTEELANGSVQASSAMEVAN